MSDSLPLPLRILAWVVAIPLALGIVGLPARRAGYLTSQKLLDVIVQHDAGRFVPLAFIVVLWAVATTVLVTILVEGGRLIRRRRHRRDGGPDGFGPITPGSSVAGPAPGRSAVAVATVAPPPRRSR